MPALQRKRRSSAERWFSAWDQLFLAYAPYVASNMPADNPLRGRRLLGVRHRRWPHRLHLAACALVLLTLLMHLCRVLPSGTVWIGFMFAAVLSMRPAWRSLRLARARAVRTRLFAELHRSSGTGEPHPGVAAVLQDRRSYWKKPCATFYSGSPTHAFYALDPVAQHMAFAALALFISVSFLVQLRIGLVWIAALIAIALGAASTQRLRWVRTRTQRRISSSQCPDCSYPLAELPDAIDPLLVGGARTGPARCPECGTHWPLVPPPGLYDKFPAPHPATTLESAALKHAMCPTAEAAQAKPTAPEFAPHVDTVGFWDRIPWVGMIGWSEAGPRGNESWATFRRRLRIDAYERAAASASPQELAMNHAPWASEALLRHHRSRVAYWHSRHTKWLVEHTVEQHLPRLFALFGYAVLSLIVLVFVAALARAWTIIVAILMVAGSLLVVRRSSRRREAVRGFFLRGCCPQCAYQIACPATSAPPQAWMPIGPRVCPECGTAWPLVPPPFPQDRDQP